MGLKPLGENAVVAGRGYSNALMSCAMWDLVESPFSICAQHRAHHVPVHLVVPQRPYGLLPVEAVQFKRER
jgi:hypothetical protein